MSKESELTDDPEINSQRWALLSFISPENVLARKDTFLFTSFVNQYEFSMKTKLLEEYLANTVNSFNKKLDAEASRLDSLDLSGAAIECRNSLLNVGSYLTNLHEFVKKNQKELSKSKLQGEYDDFMYKNSTTLEDKFYVENEFRTTVRGLKIRGSYGTKEEADARAKKMQKSDPNHNIYVGQVGKWLPWDPNPKDIAEQEYAEDELNTLMKKHNENQEQAKEHHKERETMNRATKKTVITMPPQEAGAAVSDSTSAEFSGMFSGTADLAMARKMEINKPTVE